MQREYGRTVTKYCDDIFAAALIMLLRTLRTLFRRLPNSASPSGPGKGEAVLHTAKGNTERLSAFLTQWEVRALYTFRLALD